MKYVYPCFMLVGFTLILNLAMIVRAERRNEDTRRWVENLQAVIPCTSVSIPCAKCQNTVYNVSMFGDGPSVIRSRCAKCGAPHAEEEKRLIKWYAQYYK